MKWRKLRAKRGATASTTAASTQSRDNNSAVIASVVPRSVRIVNVWPVTKTEIAPTSSITRAMIAPVGVRS